jgi:hypothetical protein
MGEHEPERRTGERRNNAGGSPPPGTVVDRRLGLDPRNRAALTPTPAPTPARAGSEGGSIPTPKSDLVTGTERAPGRRRSDFTKAAEEGEMTTEQFLFLMAIDAFKKSNDRMFPTWTDVLEVVRLLGYRKTMPSELNLNNADDWREKADSAANVRPQRWAERFHKTDRQRADEAIAAFEASYGGADDDDDAESAA